MGEVFKNKAFHLSATWNESTTFGTTKQTLYCFFLLQFASSKINKSINTVL